MHTYTSVCMLGFLISSSFKWYTPECSGNIDYSTITQNHTETLVTSHISAFLDDRLLKYVGRQSGNVNFLAVLSPVCWNKEVVLENYCINMPGDLF